MSKGAIILGADHGRISGCPRQEELTRKDENDSESASIPAKVQDGRGNCTIDPALYYKDVHRVTPQISCAKRWEMRKRWKGDCRQTTKHGRKQDEIRK